MTSVSSRRQTLGFRPLGLRGAWEIEATPVGDQRGYFVRTYDKDLFGQRALQTHWAQENQSWSARRGTIRGLHFQRPPHAETKLVRVVSGAILDVLVDLRRASPTYGRWEALELSADNFRMAYVPRGFAHGFCTLADDSVVAYKVDAPYAADAEGGLPWDDPDIGIAWPADDPIVSERDRGHAPFQAFRSPF